MEDALLARLRESKTGKDERGGSHYGEHSPVPIRTMLCDGYTGSTTSIVDDLAVCEEKDNSVSLGLAQCTIGDAYN